MPRIRTPTPTPTSSLPARAASSRSRRRRKRAISPRRASTRCWRWRVRASPSSPSSSARRSALAETRRITGGRLAIATHNPGKLVEIAELLQPYGVEVVGAAALGLPEPEETGTTFEANAQLKAVAAAHASGLPALADDSGLAVAALGGAPGIYSARWAGPKKDFAAAMQRVERDLAGKPDRRAAFVAVLALAWPDGAVEIFRGEVHGT